MNVLFAIIIMILIAAIFGAVLYHGFKSAKENVDKRKEELDKLDKE